MPTLISQSVRLPWEFTTNMRLELTIARDPKHTDTVTGLGWVGSDELISAADDRQLLRWNGGEVASVVAQLPDNVYPTDMHW
jgi:intraflagellar transport protein 80